MWYVYVLKSTGKKYLYIGSTNNLERRMQEHNTGQCRSSAPFKPYQLLMHFVFQDEKHARSLEQYLKTGSGRTILKKRILNDEDLAMHEVQSEA